MGIINRDLSQSQQRSLYSQEYAPANLVTGASNILLHVPMAMSLDAVQFAAFGVSGSPTAQLVINRFITGSGFTAINVGSATAHRAFGTSGVLASGASIPAIGSTLTTLQVNDVLMFQTGGANSALTGLVVSVVVRPLVDYQTFYNLV